MSFLLEYMNSLFVDNPTIENIKPHFASEMGVDVQFEDDLYLFKYNMIEVKWNEVSLECRGVILHFNVEDNIWEYVSRPPDKFFNIREGRCGISNDWISENKDHLKLIQKADGTAIQMYYWKGKWKVSTLGKINPLKIQDYNFTFEELFWDLFKGNLDLADKKVCYFHELCTTYNAIVTQYPESTLFLLLGRNVETGEYISTNELDHTAIAFNEKSPVSYFMQDLNINSLEDIESFTESEVDEVKYGKNSEGFVLYSNKPLGKSKNSKYLALHRVMAGSSGYTINSLLSLFFAGAIDDFYDDLTKPQQEFIDNIKTAIREISSSIESFFSSIEPNTDRKTFALAVNSNSDISKFSPYMFGRFSNNESSSFSDWLVDGKDKKNWMRYEDGFKLLFNMKKV